MYTAIGAHVFAGGFTAGVMRHPDWEVTGQLEIHDLGSETVRQRLGLPVVLARDWHEWPRNLWCDMLYGNPRCTGFSCVTAGLGSQAHGPWSKQTKDVHDMIKYGLSMIPKPAVIAWESVQQAYTVGRPMIKYLVDEMLAPAGYDVCHLFLTAAAFQNAQHRRRYFFVAYQRDRGPFNVEPPQLAPYRTTLRDAIGDLEDRQTRDAVWGEEFDDDTCFRLCPLDAECVPHLSHGYGINELARYHFDKLPARYQQRWTERNSDIPFSMHCPRRLAYDAFAPTLFGACHNLVHPVHDRTLTILELSRIMGWDYTPVGSHPYGQIAKGIVPAIGTWLAQQVKYYLEGAWGSQDYASRYKARESMFVEEPRPGPHEKVFHLNEYRPYSCRAYEAFLERMRAS